MDEQVIDYACEDAGVSESCKRKVGKEMSAGEERRGEGLSQGPQKHLRVHTYSVGGGDV